jgi:hypothetical protein
VEHPPVEEVYKIDFYRRRIITIRQSDLVMPVILVEASGNLVTGRPMHATRTMGTEPPDKGSSERRVTALKGDTHKTSKSILLMIFLTVV